MSPPLEHRHTAVKCFITICLLRDMMRFTPVALVAWVLALGGGAILAKEPQKTLLRKGIWYVVAADGSSDVRYTGPFKEYYSNGRLWREGICKDGKPHGPAFAACLELLGPEVDP